MDFLKGLFGARTNVRANNRKNLLPAAPPAPPAPTAAPVPTAAPALTGQYGGRKRTRKACKGRKVRKASRKYRKGAC
jgi:hypothetical protein